MAKKNFYLIHWAIMGETLIHTKNPEEAKRQFRIFKPEDIVDDAKETRITGYTIPEK